MSYTIKIFFSEPGQRYAVVASLKVGIADTGTESALEVLIKEAMSLQADAIIFKKAPSDSHILAGPLYADAIQFYQQEKEMTPARGGL